MNTHGRVIFLCTKFHVPSSIYSLVIATKPKTVDNFRTSGKFLLYYGKIPYHKLHFFSKVTSEP